jgi:hypothetical membrane protein
MSGPQSEHFIGRRKTIRAHIRNTSSLAGIIGPAVLAATTLMMHAFQENYDWLHQTISQLGQGPHGWIENTGFITFGVLMVIFVEALYSGFRRRRSLVAVMAIWILVGLGFITIGIFRVDVAGSSTLHGLIHSLTTRALAVLFPIACFLLIPSFEGDPHWHNMVWYTIFTGAFALLLDSLSFPLSRVLLKSWTGLYERVVLLNALTWLEVVAIRLLPHRHDLVG